MHMNPRRSGPGARSSSAFPAQDRNFLQLSMFDQLSCAFPHFRVENIRKEMGGRDTTILEQMMRDLQGVTVSMSFIGIPPRHGELHDIFYTPIPRSRLSIRFYPGGNMAAREQVYCMDVYDHNRHAPVAIPSGWTFFKILAPDDVYRVLDPDQDFSGSAVPESQLETLESVFEQPSNIAGKFVVNERELCYLVRPDIPGRFTFSAPTRIIEGVALPNPAAAYAYAYA
ncbi:hypothetical protein C8R46DRAFT_1029336 [Mycena filopes]|nr:hypothetical protein C8R46DRAFT_1029336 [Mycena filopes]